MDNAIGYLTRRVSRSLGYRLNHHFKSEGLDLTVDQWLIMLHLSAQEGQNQQQVGEACFRDKASVTRLIDALESRRWLYRTPDPLDRRNNLLFLTPDGLKIKDHLIAISDKAMAEAYQDVDPDELRQCMQTLQRVCDNIEKVA